MKATWLQTREHWMAFEADVESSREQLGCSYRGAWFRGHESKSWSLLPTAFRSSSPPGLNDILSDFGYRPPAVSDLRRPRQLRVDTPIDSAHGIESDVAARIRALVAEINQLLKQIKVLDAEIAAATVNASKQYLVTKSLHEARLEKHQRAEIQRRRSDLIGRLASKREQVITLRSLRYGEKDAYVLFRSRSNLTLGNSSWEVLAAMQHYGAPTRLLDWTDTLAVAVYFATKQFRDRMVGSKGSIPNWLEDSAAAPNMADFEGLGEPVIWILNPFRLARFAMGNNSIEDLSLRRELDYFESFHVRFSWPLTYAIPTALPWRNSRITAQRGHFTFHGTDIRGLEQQVENQILGTNGNRDPILAVVRMTVPAAVFAVRYVVEFVGLDAFSMFRDEDNLGRVLREFMQRS